MPQLFLSWRSTKWFHLGHHTLFSVVDASLALDNCTWASYKKFLIARAMQECKAAEVACVSQVITVKMSVPCVPLCRALLPFLLFYSSVTPKQIPSSSELEAEQRLLLAGAVSVQARILQTGHSPVKAQMGKIFRSFGVWGKRFFANLCMLPN